MTWQRSRIRLDNDNRAFWTGGAEGKLNIHKCSEDKCLSTIQVFNPLIQVNSSSSNNDNNSLCLLSQDK